MEDWLAAARTTLAERAGGEVDDYALGQQEIDELLDLARIAARESGERITAPLICYLVGLARGRHEAELDDVVDALVGK